MTGSTIVVGGGPAGVLLSYLLARGGVPVTLLESRGDFDRRYRGDTLAPPVLDYLDSLGMAEPLLAAVPHARAHSFRWHTPTRTYMLADYRSASRRFGYYALIPQARFLPWLAQRVEEHGARVLMGARFRALLRDGDGRVCGVEYTRGGAVEQLTADVVVATDGRSSKVRQVSRLLPTELGAHLDMLWFSVPRRPADPPLSGLDLFAAPGSTVVLLGQDDSRQIGFDIPAGTLPERTGPRRRADRRGDPAGGALAGRPARRAHRGQPAHAAAGADHVRGPVDRAGPAPHRRRGTRHLAGRRQRHQLRPRRRRRDSEPARRAAARDAGRPGARRRGTAAGRGGSPASRRPRAGLPGPRRGGQRPPAARGRPEPRRVPPVRRDGPRPVAVGGPADPQDPHSGSRCPRSASAVSA